MADVIYFTIHGPTWRNGAVVDQPVGNTQQVAEQIARREHTIAREIVVAAAYPDDYAALAARSNTETNVASWPRLSAAPDPTSETVYLGFPIWNGNLPPAVQQWLTQVELAGKIVRPFATHEGSGLGTSEATLRRRLPGTKIERGLAIRGSRADKAECALNNWLLALAVDKDINKGDLNNG